MVFLIEKGLIQCYYNPCDFDGEIEKQKQSEIILSFLLCNFISVNKNPLGVNFLDNCILVHIKGKVYIWQSL